MATPKHDAEYEATKQKAKELIAAGGCYAIQFWSHTDALRLCPKEHNNLEAQLEVPIYIHEWVNAGEKAIQLIQEGIDLLGKTKIAEERYSSEQYQRLFNAISETGSIAIQSQMDDIIKIVHEDFPATLPTREPEVKKCSSEMGLCRICGGDQCDSDSHK